MIHLRYCTVPAYLLILLMTCFACQASLEQVEHTDEFGDQLRYQRRTKDYAKEGTFERRSASGQLVEIANYRNDTLHGKRILFYESGDTSSIETYKKGTFSGPYQLFFPDGTVKQAGRYRDNLMVGKWKGYYENGQVKEVVQFENNEENGPFIEYHANGNLKAEGSYLDGDYEHGELKLYDEDGELERTMDCINGRCSTTWSRDGKPTN